MRNYMGFVLLAVMMLVAVEKVSSAEYTLEVKVSPDKIDLFKNKSVFCVDGITRGDYGRNYYQRPDLIFKSFDERIGAGYYTVIESNLTLSDTDGGELPSRFNYKGELKIRYATRSEISASNRLKKFKATKSPGYGG